MSSKSFREKPQPDLVCVHPRQSQSTEEVHLPTEDGGPVLDVHPTDEPLQLPAQDADPFGREDGGGVHYKTLTWWQCSFLMIAETISLGILSLPSVISTMGFVPGVLLISSFGILATYTGVVCGEFKKTCPSIHSFSDASRMMFGRYGRTAQIVTDIAQAMVFIFIMSAHILAFSIMMNVLTRHATCSLVFAAVGTLLSLVLTLPRTLKNVSYLSSLSCASIAIAVIITMIGVGILRPNAHTAVPFVTTLTSTASAQAYSLGISNIVIAFTGHTAYFGFISELRNPADFRKSLALLQCCSISFYIVVAVVIYKYAGDTVSSPALGSASRVVRMVAYAVASPTIVVAGVVNGHMCVKNVYVRRWKGTNVMHERSTKAVGSWWAMCAVVWIVAFLIASSVPVFSNLLGLVGALFCSWFSLGLPAAFWIYMHREELLTSWKQRALVLLNLGILLISLVVCIIGTWASAKAMAESARTMPPFSCADNSL